MVFVAARFGRKFSYFQSSEYQILHPVPPSRLQFQTTPSSRSQNASAARKYSHIAYEEHRPRSQPPGTGRKRPPLTFVSIPKTELRMMGKTLLLISPSIVLHLTQLCTNFSGICRKESTLSTMSNSKQPAY